MKLKSLLSQRKLRGKVGFESRNFKTDFWVLIELTFISEKGWKFKETLSTIQENYSVDVSGDDEVNTNKYYDSMYSCEPYDLENSLQEQLNVNEFKMKIDSVSQSEENDSEMRDELLLDKID